MLFMQIAPPDVVAQAAGHLSRNAYYSYMTLDPLERPEFREMALILFHTWKNSLHSSRR